MQRNEIFVYLDDIV